MFINKTAITFLGLMSSTFVLATVPPVPKPFYVGINGGFGSTTWQGLVPAQKNQNYAINASMPIKVQEGGLALGVFTGYEFTRYFALEAGYRHYPGAKVTFDSYSIFAFDHDHRVRLNTDTDAVSLMAKVMLTVPKTALRVYSSFGVAGVHRTDEITKQIQVSPTFGAGLSINVTPRVMVDFGFNYTAGYGESQMEPINTYIPFLYSGSIGLAYRI